MGIVLLGSRSAGKSSSGNTILRRKDFGTSGRTAECVSNEGRTAGRRITVVDTPGWFSIQTAAQTPERDKQEIIRSVSLCPPGPHALLLVIRVTWPFTETKKRAVQEHLELLGERVWSHTIVLFTRGDCLGDTSIEQHIESGGEALQWLVEKCGNRYHVVDNEKSDGGQVTELLEKIEEMVAGNKGCPFLLKQSKDDPLNFREPLPGDGSGSRSGQRSVFSRFVSDLMSPLKRPLVAASTQSSGYGTGETAEGSGDTADRLKNINFVDPSKITVDYKHSIGRGSYGTVYKGSYQDTPGAVKIMAIGNTAVITNEFLIPLRLSHLNIVRMLAVARSETEILIANEYIHGANLQMVLYKSSPIKLQSKDKLQVAFDIAMAVEYIHDKRIIHNDLKPANIMVTADTRKASLTDWGLAECKETITMTTGQLLGGTPPYMAPECLVECKKGSFLSDMWSLGITLLEMFTNSEPWTTVKPQEIREHLYDRQKPHALDKLQTSLNDIVRPLLEHEPNARMNAKNLVTLLKKKVALVPKR